MTRPRIHFTAETGWINDPHGITFHDGEYHLFHQYVPDSTVWAPNCHWGHAVGPDLLHWDRRPVALAPGDGDDGIWTGSLVDRPDGAVILYTSTVQPDLGRGRIRIARATDGSWDHWEKGAVLLETPDDLDLIAFRDPFIIREGKSWRMVVGAGTADGDALAVTYTSTDLQDWTFDGVAARRNTAEREPVWVGALWECPQIIEVDGRHVLVSSVWDDDVLYYAGYGVGSYANGRFDADTWGRLSFGESYYAPSFFRDADGRPCLMFWMRGVEDGDVGWSSALSVPHVLEIRDGSLVTTAHPSLEAARAGRADLSRIAGQVVDLEWTPGGIGERIDLLNAGERVAALIRTEDSIVLERTGEETWSAPHAGGMVRIILDGPVLEAITSAGVLGGAVSPVTAVTVNEETVSAYFLE
ncbi:glycoside hydrolase family 32 protein [Rathayibacter tritici]|uniref:beta-fructofuranosidase n=1 Tax=Rathayibacter tritici TaxID=33888 RepID=A0A160KTC6_9MICO|nr:glycoside hydrolase family 32 protein [Rathayibacter tritici]AND16458.1 glycosyl hydrolase family 32 [Rathayibacter tritici]PPI43019.1 glycoside hydrolase family 32 protein [Rathayibacter tritici]